MKFQNWSQEPAYYNGAHGTDEVVITITVEDVLAAMYEVNIELSDENLERVMDELDLNGFWHTFTSFVDTALNK